MYEKKNRYIDAIHTSVLGFYNAIGHGLLSKRWIGVGFGTARFLIYFHKAFKYIIVHYSPLLFIKGCSQTFLSDPLDISAWSSCAHKIAVYYFTKSIESDYYTAKNVTNVTLIAITIRLEHGIQVLHFMAQFIFSNPIKKITGTRILFCFKHISW